MWSKKKTKNQKHAWEVMEAYKRNDQGNSKST
jgi:hypothetical protein